MSSRAALITSLLAVVLSLAGCITDLPGHLLDNFNPLSRLSTAASMRVEVEVYKGPLSKNVSVQWGELDGLVDEVVDSFTNFNDNIVEAAARMGYVTGCTTCKTASCGATCEVPDCAACKTASCGTTCEVPDCATCKAKVSIDPHYRSKKIAEQNGGKILPRTSRPEIDTRIIEKIDETFMHENNSSPKILWCASEKFQTNEDSLIWCHAVAKAHDDIRILLEELHDLHEIMHSPSPVGSLKNLLDTAVDNFNKVYTFIIAAKEKVDRLKNSCVTTCDLTDVLFLIRMDLEEAKVILKGNVSVWNDSKQAVKNLSKQLDEMKGNTATEIIVEAALDRAQRLNEKVLQSIEFLEKKMNNIVAETHFPFFATHPLTLAEWSRDLGRAASQLKQLSDFLSNQVYGCSGAVASTASRKDRDTLLVSVSCEQRKRIMKQVARVAIKLKAKAMYWAESHAVLAPAVREIRIGIATFANLASEYSNQLESLADGLQWQLGEEGKGINAKQLPLSVYLRNAETTDFLNLYTWNRAAAPAIWEEMLLHPSTAFSSEETADRVRVIERLMADYNWEKVNTVYGSGQDDFAMALIKDEIGNWNLKSFDSDPTELIEAYTKLARTVALTAIGRVPLLPTEIEGTTGLSNVLNMNALHKRVVEKLETIKAEASTSTVTRGQKNDVMRQIRAVLDDYEAEIDILQESLMTFKAQ